MSYIRDRELPAKVKAVNRANMWAMIWQQKLIRFFSPYVGHKILKADGSLLAKIKLPDFPRESPGARDLHVYRGRSDYSLYWVVRTCEMIDETTCTYHEQSFTVGELDGDKLKNLSPLMALRMDYNVEVIRELRKKAEEAKKAYEDAKSACFPFGEY